MACNGSGCDRWVALARLVTEYRPGGDWETWDAVEEALLASICLCCGQPGHYQQMLEAHLAAEGLTEGVYLDGGRVQDGHHRVVAARRLGIDTIPLESREQAGERWVRDHGYVDWRHRKVGDVPDYDTLNWCLTPSHLHEASRMPALPGTGVSE